MNGCRKRICGTSGEAAVTVTSPRAPTMVSRSATTRPCLRHHESRAYEVPVVHLVDRVEDIKGDHSMGDLVGRAIGSAGIERATLRPAPLGSGGVAVAGPFTHSPR